MKLFLALLVALLLIALFWLPFALPANVLQFIGSATLIVLGLFLLAYLGLRFMAKAMAS